MTQNQSNKIHWTAFFSQTGSEIVEVSNKLGCWPDIICTNKPTDSIDSINYEILDKCYDRLFFLPSKPVTAEYETVLKMGKKKHKLTTLHGYLRIIPAAVCEKFEMYNGHPGDIVTYPKLKGFNPQEKAFKLKLKNTGSVIHRVTSGVDDGPIAAFKKCNINLKSLAKTYSILHNNSINLWVEFLAKQFNISL